MYAPPISPHLLRLPHFFTRWLAALFAAVLLALAVMPARAAAPAAGASISNQASASYADGSGVSRTVTSNTVSTTVTQVASLTLAANGAQTATPGSVVYYPHTLTNTGNGSDTFNLTSANTGGFAMTTVQFFADNGSGQPTGSAITSSGALAAGTAFKFIVVGTLPSTAVTAQTNAIVVTAASALTPAQTASNTDTTTVTNNAVVTLTKAVSVSTGAPGSGPYTYTLTYTNTGNSTASAVAITDVIPAGMTYVAASARWSVTGSAALSDSGVSSGTSPNTLTSGYTAATKTFLATLNSVTAGQSGTITFNVNVDAAIAPGVLNNVATTSYNNGAATVTGSSNTVPFTVQQTAAVTFTGPAAATPSANTGATVSFTNQVKNTGTGADTFNIKLAASNSFPSGTTFQLFKSDGLTPLVDTNGDGIIDTGPLAANATYDVILKATLPPNASGAGPFVITKTATSVVDPTKSATATDTLTAITGASVDLTNNSVTGPGVGAGPEATVQVTNTVNPGTTTVFTLVAKNTGPSPDSFNFSASTVPGFGSLTPPLGWTVTFKADGGSGTACSSTGATIVNSGNVAAGSAATVCAVVTVPAGFAAGTNDLYFRSLSPTSGASDILHDAVTVNAVRSITITPNGAGQTYPGGSFVYSHTLTNTGNVTEGNGTLSTITLGAANNQTGWTSTLYYDNGPNGTLDATDPLITGALNAVLAAGLAPGASITIFDKVIAPSGAVPGAVNATTITVTTTNGTYSTTVPAPTVATDSTTVIAGNLTLTKAQSLDVNCTGTAGVYTAANLNAKPGECVLYQITVTNVGSANATTVVVSDVTPTYTKLKNLAATTVGTVTGPAVGAAGAISAAVGTLTPSQSAVVTFGVQIDN
ncbi:MAG: hypothetical protein ABI642_02380 [Polaromonas sp.]